MNEAYKIARASTEKRKAAARKRQGRQHQSGQLEIGDGVLIKNVVERGGPGKIRAYWEQKVYTVRDIKQGGVVYTVQKEDVPSSRQRTVHCNLLMPCQNLILQEDTPVARVKENTWKPELSAAKPFTVMTRSKRRGMKLNSSESTYDQNEIDESQNNSDDEMTGKRMRQHLLEKTYTRMRTHIEVT